MKIGWFCSILIREELHATLDFMLYYLPSWSTFDFKARLFHSNNLEVLCCNFVWCLLLLGAAFYAYISTEVFFHKYLIQFRNIYKIAISKVSSVQEACAKTLAVHLLKSKILQATYMKKQSKEHQNANSIVEKLITKGLQYFKF